MVDKLHILTLNSISHAGLKLLPSERYEVSNHADRPDAILVRSHDMHAMVIPDSVKAVGRAGAGTNNIPVEALSQRGVPVFNAPGANANAVKELVLAGLLLAARNLVPAVRFVEGLRGSDEDLTRLVEDNKKHYAGIELPHRTLEFWGWDESAAWWPTPPSSWV
jgi:D-3-phosphoglycerate dehydrogenase